MDLPTKSTQFKSNSLKAGKHEGACSCSMPLQHAPGETLPRLHQRFLAKHMLRNKTFAPEFCSLISNWFDMREQAPCANLLHESVSGTSSLVCTEICLPWNDVSLVGQSNCLIFSSTTHCELTFKMAAEEVEEDSVPIIDNKKSEETSRSVRNTILVIASTEITVYSTIKSVKTMEIKSQRRKYFHLYWSNLNIRSLSKLKRSKKNPLKNQFFRFQSRTVRRHVGFITTSSYAPIGLFHHSAPSSSPTGWGTYPGARFRSKLPRVYRPLTAASSNSRRF